MEQKRKSNEKVKKQQSVQINSYKIQRNHIQYRLRYLIQEKIKKLQGMQMQYFNEEKRKWHDKTPPMQQKLLNTEEVKMGMNRSSTDDTD